MSFPFTSVLDDFDRPNAATLGANWSPFWRAGNDAGIINYQAYDANNTWNGLYWNVAQYGPDCEVYVTMAALLTKDADQIILWARTKDVVPGAWNYDGYALPWFRVGAGNHTLALQRVDNSVATQLGATVSITPVAGDVYGLQAEGSALRGYQNGAMILERSDATYNAAGYIGFAFPNHASWRLDDFGGGTTGEIIVNMLYRAAWRSQDG